MTTANTTKTRPSAAANKPFTRFGPTAEDKPDAFAKVTEKIIAYLEKGVRPWHQPWKAKQAAGSITRPLRSVGSPYHGINTVVLWITAIEKGYSSPFWMTYNQARDYEAHVRKGEKGTTVFYASRFTKVEADANGEEKEVEIPFLKQYTVFNVEQVEGLPPHFAKLEERTATVEERIGHAEDFAAKTKADIRHGGGKTFYMPGEDRIQMPPYETFEGREAYYSTLFHELTHWTAKKSRLDRSLDSKRFGDTGYAREELVAELGAAFLCCDLGITPEVREDHAGYLSSWLKVLKEDSKAIFQAAAAAEKAATYLQQMQIGLQPAE